MVQNLYFLGTESEWNSISGHKNAESWHRTIHYGNTVQVNDIVLNATSATLQVGDTKQLTATVSPNDATEKSVTWTSINENVATVNADGLVTAVAKGTATITCTANDGSGITATCEVTVTPAPPSADELAIAEAIQFKSDYAEILNKTTSTVTSSDFNAINYALLAYNRLSDAAKAKLNNGEKQLLDSLKAKAEELKNAEEADAAAANEANQFKADYAAILRITTSTVASSDLNAINNALIAYNRLSDAAKAKLNNGEKQLLDSIKAKAEELKKEEEADALAVSEANKFMKDNATILLKTTSTVTSSDLNEIIYALVAYDRLSERAKSKLANDEKSLLESLKSKAEELKAAEEADQKATEDANDFKYENKDILGKSIYDITLDDLGAIEKALEAYEELPDTVKEKLNDEKADLDKKKQKVDEITSVISAVDTIDDSSKYYRLNGLRINSNAKGFIIKNGKMMFVK